MIVVLPAGKPGIRRINLFKINTFFICSAIGPVFAEDLPWGMRKGRYGGEMGYGSGGCGGKLLDCLSPREKEVLKWLKMGKTSWDIAQILRISERTVNYHVGNIMKKLGVVSRMQAVSVAAECAAGGGE